MNDFTCCFSKNKTYEWSEVRDIYSRYLISCIIVVINIFLIIILLELTRGFINVHTQVKDETVQTCKTINVEVKYNQTVDKYVGQLIIKLLTLGNQTTSYNKLFEKQDNADKFIQTRPIGFVYLCLVNKKTLNIISIKGNFNHFFISQFYGEILFYSLAVLLICLIFTLNICICLIYYLVMPILFKCMENYYIYNSYNMV